MPETLGHVLKSTNATSIHSYEIPMVIIGYYFIQSSG